jgi:osmoprotectant transport system ATP-binding protein
VITFESVTKKYADGAIAVDDVSMEFATGRITVLVGCACRKLGFAAHGRG